MSDRRTRAVHIDDLDRVPLDIGMWRPGRRPLGITAIGVNG